MRPMVEWRNATETGPPCAFARPLPARRGLTRVRAVKPAPDDLYRTAIRLHQQGKTREAAALYDAVLAQRPLHAGALHLKGVLALQAGDYRAAATLIERSLELEPRHGLALANLGVAYRAQDRFDAAIALFRRALVLDPADVNTLANLGQTLVRAGQIEEAVVWCRRALDRDPNRLGLQSSLLFAQNYLAESAPLEMTADARRVGSLFAAANPPRTHHPNDPDPARQLRVGLVSGDFRAHPVGRFLMAVVPALDPKTLELFAYATSRDEDEITAQLRQAVPHWNNVTDLPGRALTAQIVADKIDVLVDLSGHTASHRLAVFAGKPAPVSFTWLGYFATTGLSAIDYVLANRWVIPETETAQWVEQVWRMPDTYLCFTAPPAAPAVSPLPAATNGSVTFGCFNNFNKLTGRTLAAWSALLAATPGSRLILRSSGGYPDGMVEALGERLAAAGIDRARVRIDGKIADYAAHLQSYAEIDIALDPFPYNGGTTTVEALFMGVPVLVKSGDRYVAHMGESILHNAGLPEWIAPDEAGYATLGAQLAADRPALAALRAGLRQRMLASPLFDAPHFASNFEDALRGMWQVWCAAQDRG